MLELIKKIKSLEETRGSPFNSVKLKEARKEITQKLIRKGVEILEVENYILKVGYTSKDRTRPYTQIFTKESFKKHKEYAKPKT